MSSVFRQRIIFQSDPKQTSVYIQNYVWGNNLFGNSVMCNAVGGTKHWVRAHVDDDTIAWRTTHNNSKLNAIWFAVTLTDTNVEFKQNIISMEF